VWFPSACFTFLIAFFFRFHRNPFHKRPDVLLNPFKVRFPLDPFFIYFPYSCTGQCLGLRDTIGSLCFFYFVPQTSFMTRPLNSCATFKPSVVFWHSIGVRVLFLSPSPFPHGFLSFFEPFFPPSVRSQSYTGIVIPLLLEVLTCYTSVSPPSIM